MDATAAALIAWIAAKSGLAASEPPRIRFVPEYQMSYLFDSADQQSRDLAPTDLQDTPMALGSSKGSHVLAFYVRNSSTIYLPATWRAESLRDQGILVHELVHHVQRFNKLRPDCPGALERQAYVLQAAWLAEQGVEDPYKMTGMDLFTILILTACAPPE